MVFSTNNIKAESSKKLELFKVLILLVITGKLQTLARNISGMHGCVFIRIFRTVRICRHFHEEFCEIQQWFLGLVSLKVE